MKSLSDILPDFKNFVMSDDACFSRLSCSVLGGRQGFLSLP